MDSQTKIQELKEKVKAFCDARDWAKYHGAKDLAIGLITESSELLELFRFKSQQEIEAMFSDLSKRQEIAEELADSFYFVLRFAERYNIDLSIELQKKMSENEKKYPVEKSKGSNKKYDEL
jgi:NTP pyrophosphatase (non-canonical NTP hydrolase)